MKLKVGMNSEEEMGFALLLLEAYFWKCQGLGDPLALVPGKVGQDSESDDLILRTVAAALGRGV